MRQALPHILSTSKPFSADQRIAFVWTSDFSSATHAFIQRRASGRQYSLLSRVNGFYQGLPPLIVQSRKTFPGEGLQDIIQYKHHRPSPSRSLGNWGGVAVTCLKGKAPHLAGKASHFSRGPPALHSCSHVPCKPKPRQYLSWPAAEFALRNMKSQNLPM